jgi:hypothetical protein
MLKLADQHLLAFLEFAQIIDVGRCAEPFDDRPPRIADRCRPRLEPPITVLIGMEDTIVCMELAALDRVRPNFARPLAIFRMHHIKPAVTVAVDLGLPGKFGPLRACPGPCAEVDRAPYQLRYPGHQCLETPLGFAQFRQVMTDPANEADLTCGIPDREVGVSQPTDRAVSGSFYAIVERDILTLSDTLDRRAGNCAILRHDELQPAAIIVAGERVFAAYSVDRLESGRQIAPLQRLGIADP